MEIKMRKITENALLYRVNQLREKMAMMEAPLDPNRKDPWNLSNPQADILDQVNKSKIPSNTPVTQPLNQQSTTPLTPPVKPPVTPVKPPVTPVTPPVTPVTPPVTPVTPPVTPVTPPVTPVKPSTADGSDYGNMPTNNTSVNPNDGSDAGNAPSNNPEIGAQFPKTPAEIQAFQKAHGLKVDGLIGPNTLTALAKAGLQPPAGFKMAGAKRPAPAPHPVQQGGAAKPAAKQGAAPGTVGYVDPKTGAVSSGDEERDERLAQFGQVAQMTPAQQHMFYQGAAEQDAATAGTASTGRQGTKADLDQMYKAFGNQTAPAKTAPAQTANPYSAALPNMQMAEHVSFGQDDSLARIMQLVKW